MVMTITSDTTKRIFSAVPSLTLADWHEYIEQRRSRINLDKIKLPTLLESPFSPRGESIVKQTRIMDGKPIHTDDAYMSVQGIFGSRRTGPRENRDEVAPLDGITHMFGLLRGQTPEWALITISYDSHETYDRMRSYARVVRIELMTLEALLGSGFFPPQDIFRRLEQAMEEVIWYYKRLAEIVQHEVDNMLPESSFLATLFEIEHARGDDYPCSFSFHTRSSGPQIVRTSDAERWQSLLAAPIS